MTNLLPGDSLRDVRSFYRSRFIFVGSVMLIACAAVAFFLLVPAYIVVHPRGDVSPDASQTSLSLEEETSRADIGRSRTLLRELRTVATSSVLLLPLLEEVLASRPTGIFVERVDIVRGEKGTLVLSGRATSRDAIDTYRSVLSENMRFQRISIPLDVLAGAEGDRFTLTLSGSL